MFQLGALLRLSLLAVAASGAFSLPLWYDSRRTHAHTRLPIDAFCDVTTKTCTPVFENVANLFDELNITAFVRHSKTGDEGTWWPTATGPRESWNPLVQATGRNFPKEFIQKAHANDQKIILYHWPQSSAYYLHSSNMTWANRNPNGTLLPSQRGTALCVNSPWRHVYISQLLELVDFGADGIYFDHYPQPPQGCWCQYCRDKFRAWSGGLDLPKGINISDPVYVKLLQFNTMSVQEHFQDITSALYAKSSQVALIISVFRVSCVDDGYQLYETTRLINTTASSVAKTEFKIAGAKVCTSLFNSKSEPFYRDRFDLDILLSLGYSISRDAANGRPPHVWLPHLSNSSQALAAAFVQLTFGAVANPDHRENHIPDHELFDLTYKMTKLVNPFLSETRPLRWAGVLFSEEARNKYFSSGDVAEWENVLFPTVSAWEMLVHRQVPAGVITDWQLAFNETTQNNLYEDGYQLIIVPTENVTASQEKGLSQFEANGGKVYRIKPGKEWVDANARSHQEDTLWLDLLKLSGNPPIRIEFGAVQSRAHANVFRANATSFVIMITNDFLWVYYNYAKPNDIADASVILSSVRARSLAATDVLGHGKLEPESSGNGNWTIALPKISQFMAVSVVCSEDCW